MKLFRASLLFIDVLIILTLQSCSGLPLISAPAIAYTLPPTPMIIPTFTNVPNPTPLSSLPSLYVDGPYIRRSDTKDIVYLKGVAVTTFEWSTSPYKDTIKLLSIAQPWNINVLRLGMAVVTTPQYLDQLDKVIDWCERHGIYVILDPHALKHNQEPALPDDDVVSLMGTLAGRYAGKPNVLYGLWNEPGKVDWTDWWPWAIKISEAIRSANPQSILVVSGTQWSRDFRYLELHPFPYQNVIYDVHDYAWTGEDIRPWWIWMVGKFPIVLGEFGGTQASNQFLCPYQSSCDLQYMEDTLNIVNDYPGLLHYTAFEMEPSDGGLTTKSGDPTERGKLIISDLSLHPPTNFYAQLHP